MIPNACLKVNPAAAGGENQVDEDKPRERDTQSPALASAKRILAHEDPSPRRGATHVRPHGAVGDFFCRRSRVSH